MNSRFRFSALLFSAFLGLAAFCGGGGRASAQDVSFQVFQDSLGNEGSWSDVSDYGECWQPAGVDPDWQPYTNGQWAYTDAGWTWISDDSEPWGWAVYHYGRWVFLDGRGWFWVPGYTWGASWVSWRYGNGYCGWAPLPPHGVPLRIGFYSFCRTGDVGARSLRSVIVGRGNNAVIVNQTTLLTNRYNGHHGPPIDQINQGTARPVPRMSLERNGSGGPRGPQRNGDTLSVYAPSVARPAPGQFHSSRPVAGIQAQSQTLSRPPALGGAPAPAPQQAPQRSAVTSGYGGGYHSSGGAPVGTRPYPSGNHSSPEAEHHAPSSSFSAPSYRPPGGGAGPAPQTPRPAQAARSAPQGSRPPGPEQGRR